MKFDQPNNKALEKLFKRGFIIFLNAFNSIIILFGNLLISYCVVTFTSSALWGSFVHVVIALDIAFNIISWGNRHYLIRDFSLMPNGIIKSWQTSLISRAFLLLFFLLIILFFNYPLEIKAFLMIWSIGRFLYQSYDPIVLFNMDFKFSLTIELIGLLLIIVPVIIFRTVITLHFIIFLYMASMCLKSLIFSFHYKRFFIGYSNIKFTNSYLVQAFNYFVTSFPFLLLSFSAMLQSKADLYGVAYFLNNKELAQYSIFMGFLGLSQFVASQFLSPFTKSIFRLNNKSLIKLERLFISIGFLTSLILEIVAYLLFEYVYKFHFSLYMYALGYIYIMLFYFYLVKNYKFGKANKQTRVAMFSLLCSLVNVLFCTLFIPYFGMEGALMAGIFGQVFLVIVFRVGDSESRNRLNVLING